ncbi:MAG: serine/threonine-protein kinase [Zestosphaera sp.]
MDSNLVIILAAIISSLIIIMSAITKKPRNIRSLKNKSVEPSKSLLRSPVTSQVVTQETEYFERIFKTEKNTYRLIQLVSGKEYTEVWKALDKLGKSGKTVAIKIYKKGEGSNKTFVTELRKLTQLLEKLGDNPYVSNYIVKILDFGTSPAPYIVMDYYPENLRSLTKRGVSHKDLVKIMARIAKALAYASDVGVNHGDLKPENILIKEEDGKYYPVLADWGGGFTPCYAAPEIYKYGEKMLTEKSDVWSFGVILYEVLTQNRLFKNLTEYEKRIENDVRVEIPHNPRLEELVNKCLRKNPGERPSFRDIYGELYDYLRTELRTIISQGTRDLKTTLELFESHIVLRDSISAKEELKNLKRYDLDPAVYKILTRSVHIVRKLENKTADPNEIISYFNYVLSSASKDTKLKKMLEKERCIKEYLLPIERYGEWSMISLWRDVSECIHRIVEVLEDYINI